MEVARSTVTARHVKTGGKTEARARPTAPLQAGMTKSCKTRCTAGNQTGCFSETQRTAFKKQTHQ